MPANHFKVDGTKVETFDAFMNAQQAESWSNLLYFPNSLGEKDFRAREFKGKTFREVSFKDTEFLNIRFVRCKFIRCLFIGAQAKSCEFIDCEFQSTNTHKMRFEECLVDPVQFNGNFDLEGDANIAIDLYHALYKNSVNEHQPQHAVEALYQMKEAEYRQLDSKRDRGVMGGKEYLVQKTKLGAHRFVSGYGLRFRNIVRLAIIVVGTCSVLNYVLRAHIFKDGAVNNLLDSFYYTCITMTTVGYGDIYPVTSIGKALVTLEVIAGFTVVSLLLAAVANKALQGR